MHRYGFTGVYELPRIRARCRNSADRAPLVFARQQIAYPFLAPPGIPADRTAALRQAFLETMKDKDFLADAEQAKLEIMPVAGAHIQSLITELYATPADVVAKTSEMIK